MSRKTAQLINEMHIQRKKVPCAKYTYTKAKTKRETHTDAYVETDTQTD